MKRVLLTIIVALFAASCFSQRQRNYIYVLDCTGSMTYQKLVDPAKNFMKKNLDSQKEYCSVVVLPFQEEILEKYKCANGKDASQMWEKQIEPNFDKWVKDTQKETNIRDAFKAALNSIDKNKDNYVYLMTDGKNTCPKGVSMEDVATFIKSQCGKFKNTLFYYVMLSTKAEDNNIKSVIDMCDDWKLIGPNDFGKPFGTIEPDQLNINAFEVDEKTYSLSFSTFGVFKVAVQEAYPHLDVQIIGDAINDGKIKFKFLNKYSTIQALHDAIGKDEDQFMISIMPVDNNLIITNEKVIVNITNHTQRTLNFGEDRKIGDAEWYDSFLFWGEKEQDTLQLSLDAMFNKAAKGDKSSFTICIKPGDGEKKDYKIFYNGNEVDDIFTVKADEQDHILGVVFNKDAKQEDRHFSLSYNDADRLDMVNDKSASEYEDTYNAEYNICWNPLKTILFWLGIILLVCLILWFVFVRPSISKFKVGALMITDPYFARKRINGARKLIFTNNLRAKDSIIKAIFLGKTIYEINQIWTQELEFQPGVRKTCRPILKGKYSIDPYSSAMTVGQEYEITNVNTNEKIKITIN